MSNPRERVIKKLNKQFPNLIGSEIPINQPIKSHQTRFAAAGGYRWYFTYSECLNAISDQLDIERFGSTITMTELLKHKEWVIIREDAFCYDVQPKKWFEKELDNNSVHQKECAAK